MVVVDAIVTEKRGDKSARLAGEGEGEGYERHACQELESQQEGGQEQLT